MKPSKTVLVVVAGELLIALYAVFANGFTIDGLQTTTRWSGRFSLLLFSFVFLLYPQKKEMLLRLLSEKFFLVFAVAHGIHLVELLSFVSLSGTELIPYRLAGGFVAYLMIFLMPLFQLRFNTGILTAAKFQMLGYVYLFYVWFIFFMTYVGRLTNGFPNSGSRLWHVALMSWVCGILLIKVIGLAFPRRASVLNQQP